MTLNQTKQGGLPFELNHGFTQIPNAVMRHYQYYPKFNGSTALVYGYLISQYNAEYGYAFPTHIQIAQAVNMTEKTARGHIRLLQEVGLINVTENGRFGNHTYTFTKPIEIAEEFYAKYPQAAENKRKSDATWAKIIPDKVARKVEMTKVSDDIDAELAEWI